MKLCQEGKGDPSSRKTAGNEEGFKGERKGQPNSFMNKTGAGDGDRTRDNWLGKPALYQLSYSRSKDFRFEIDDLIFRILNQKS